MRVKLNVKLFHWNIDFLWSIFLCSIYYKSFDQKTYLHRKNKSWKNLNRKTLAKSSFWRGSFFDEFCTSAQCVGVWRALIGQPTSSAYLIGPHRPSLFSEKAASNRPFTFFSPRDSSRRIEKIYNQKKIKIKYFSKKIVE